MRSGGVLSSGLDSRSSLSCFISSSLASALVRTGSCAWRRPDPVSRTRISVRTASSSSVAATWAVGLVIGRGLGPSWSWRSGGGPTGPVHDAAIEAYSRAMDSSVVSTCSAFLR